MRIRAFDNLMRLEVPSRKADDVCMCQSRSMSWSKEHETGTVRSSMIIILIVRCVGRQVETGRKETCTDQKASSSPFHVTKK